MKIEPGQRWKSRDGLRTLEVMLVGPNPEGISSLQVIKVHSETSGRTYDMSERTLRRSYIQLFPLQSQRTEFIDHMLETPLAAMVITGIEEAEVFEENLGHAAEEWYRQMGDEDEPRLVRSVANWADAHPWVIALIAAVLGFIVMYIAVWTAL